MEMPSRQETARRARSPAGRQDMLVRHSSANGVPLGAEMSESHFKPLLLDIGLCNNLCGLSLPDAADLLGAQEGSGIMILQMENNHYLK